MTCAKPAFPLLAYFLFLSELEITNSGVLQIFALHTSTAPLPSSWIEEKFPFPLSEEELAPIEWALSTASMMKKRYFTENKL